VIERTITAGVVVVVVAEMLVVVLPRLLPAITTLCVLGIVARVVWSRTR
jgi:hypothetical protein